MESAEQARLRAKMTAIIEAADTAQLRDMSRMLHGRARRNPRDRAVRMTMLLVDYELMERIGVDAFEAMYTKGDRS